VSNPTDLIARDLAVLWHPCGQMRDYASVPPLPVIGASGSRLQLADGRELIDGIASWWCKSLGHGHPHLRQALVDQAEHFEHVILANTTNPGIVRLCERLLAAANGHPSAAWSADAPVGKLPGWFSRVFFADNGSTGVEVALKMALQWQQQIGQHQRTRFAALADGYHGETAGCLSVSDLGLYKMPFASLCVDVMQIGGLPRRSGPNDSRWMDAEVEWLHIKAQLASQAHELAAIIVEPVLQGAAGMRLYSPDLLRRLRTWADAHGVLLIADEIAAGLGRLGPMLASHLSGIFPDLAVCSKGLTGGFLPMSTVLCTERIYEAFDADWIEGRAFLHSNTYAVAVANAALDVYASEQVCERVAQVGPRLQAGLQALADTRPGLREVRGCGMVAAVDLRQPDGSPYPRERRTGWQFFQAALRHGVLLRPLGDTVYLFPPLTITEAEIATLLAAAGRAIDDVVPAV
jgi:adenosylmethionine---8-amino-7-oxononanoate aminotransferase